MLLLLALGPLLAAEPGPSPDSAVRVAQGPRRPGQAQPEAPRAEVPPLVHLDLAAGTGNGLLRGGLGVGALYGEHDPVYSEIEASMLFGIEDAERSNLGRLDIRLGPQHWFGDSRVGLFTGLGADLQEGALSLHVPLGFALVYRPSDELLIKLAAQPSWIFRGPEERRRPGPIDEVALQGGAWLAPLSNAERRWGLHIGGDWVHETETEILQAGVGLGLMPV